MMLEFEAVVRYQEGVIPCGRITSTKLKGLLGKKVKVQVQVVE